MIHNRRTSDYTEEHGECADMHNDVADRAVRKVFAILGVDVSSPESVSEFQADLRFGRSLRKGADHGFMAFIGLIAIAVGAALWAGISAKLGAH